MAHAEFSVITEDFVKERSCKRLGTSRERHLHSKTVLKIGKIRVHYLDQPRSRYFSSSTYSGKETLRINWNYTGWLGNWVVSVLDAGLRRRRARVQIAVATLSGNSLRQTVYTHRASVHQAAKLVAALLRVAGVTAGLAESNGSLPPGLWLTSPAGWLPRPGSPREPYARLSSMGYFYLLHCESDKNKTLYSCR